MSKKNIKAVDTSGTEDEVRVHSYNVGHGDCTLIEYVQDGEVAFRLLVDAGENLPEALIKHLEEGRRSTPNPDIDVVLLSHVDNDHQGGLPSLLEMSFTIGEFLGPCLPAFRRLSWLFDKRVQGAIERAQVWEDALSSADVSVVYPFEGYVTRFAAGRVVLSIISPASKLLETLSISTGAELSNLLTRVPLPVQWLLDTDYVSDERPDDFGELRNMFRTRDSLSPADFRRPLPRFRPHEAESIRAAYVASCEENRVPEFFGNQVLNDTSLVAVVDVHLGGQYRRRIVLSGDQENWSYIVARHPVGLGIDVLKAPHHGGRVYLDDCREAPSDVYGWLRPKTVLVSANGKHGLPRVSFRESLRSVGAALLCSSARHSEPLTAGAGIRPGVDSCFRTFDCISDSKLRPVTTIVLTGQESMANAPACVQGLGSQVVSPIVVLQQNVITPTETFVRWTQGELEKHANWISAKLRAHHKEFLVRVGNSADPITAHYEHQAIPWSSLKPLAMSEKRYALCTDEKPVLRFGQMRRKFWRQHQNGGLLALYRMPTDAERRELVRWLKRVPNILVRVNATAAQVYGGDQVGILQSANWSYFSSIFAARLSVPIALFEDEVLPQLLLVMASSFEGRLCGAESPGTNYEPDGDQAFLWLKNRTIDVAVPDVEDESWEFFYEKTSETEFLDDLMDKALESLFLADACTFRSGGKWLADRQLLDPFDARHVWGSSMYSAGRPLEFIKQFRQSRWSHVW